MPHLFLEYSANLTEHHDIDAMVAAAHAAALADGLPPVDALRTRGIERRHYRIADGQADHAFVAITARIGPGRDPEAKLRFLRAVLDAVEAQLDSEPSPLAIAWSAEVQEIDAEFRINRNDVRSRLQEQSP